MTKSDSNPEKSVAVIGAGPMGLAVAYELLLRGYRVRVYEAGPVIGGMSAAFDFSGTAIERYYHFICATDESMFALLRELDLGEALRWKPTKMGYFIDGTLHDWGDPLALLRLPQLDLISKLRYGLHAYLCTKRKDWQPLDRLEATRWLRRWVGERAYELLWRKLFELKFYEHTDRLSAAWIWTRIKRVGTSRYNLFQEKLGYLEGGSQTLLDALQEQIEERGGAIHLSSPVEEVVVRDHAVRGVRVGGQEEPFDAVFSTVPLPLVPRMIPDLPASVREQIQALENLAVVCVIFKLRRPVSDKFWININDERMDIPGIVEYTNLRPMDAHIVYVPYYMPGDNPKYQDDNQAFIDRSWRYLQMINPALQDADLLDAYASRYRYAQPVCEPGHLDRLPPVDLPIEGLYAADTSYYYPEDRGISESVRFGRAVAQFLE
ncbi:MAG: NAD(P)/FAD-dependent oxidoreductase [Halorhodospira sp.]